MIRIINRIAAAAVLAGIVAAPANAAARAAQHSIEVALDPSSGEISVRDRVRLDARERFEFFLAPWLGIEGLRLDGAPVQPLREGQRWRVDLPGGAAATLEFELRGTLPPRTDETEMHSSSGEDGAFLPSWDAWLPWDGAEAIAYRLRVRVPQGQRAVATGKLVAERDAGGDYEAEFEVAHAGEPPSLFAGPYEVHEQVRGGVRYRTYFHAELTQLADVYLDAAAGYVARYSAGIGAYPFADFHIVSAPLPVGLGFPNLTYVGRRVLPLPFMRTRSLAHEVLHNWWGNGVAVDYAGGNWAEGLTTYMADYALERDKGEAAARSMRIKWLRDFAALPPERDRPARSFRSKQHQAAQVIGYNKVAFMFHMLEAEIGRAAFDDALRRFWQRYRYATAGWPELQAAFEDSAGRELGWFFRQWLDRRGAPRLSLGASDVEPVDESYRVRVEVLQPVAGYRLRLPVELGLVDRVERQEIVVDDTLTRLEWVVDSPPRYIRFDPDSDVFRLLGRDETPPILRDVTLDPATRVIVGDDGAAFDAAARALAARLMDVAPRFAGINGVDTDSSPLLLLTTDARLGEQLARLGVSPPVELPRVAHSAAAWTARLPAGEPLLVISTASAAELQALGRPLPHYGGQSYVLFEAGRALARGIWPLRQGALYREF